MPRKDRDYTPEELKQLRREQPEPSNAFVRACAEGDLDAVRRQLTAGADINQRDLGFKTDYGSCGDHRQPGSFHQTGLEMAVRTKNLALLKLLMAAGADPYTQEAPHRGNAISLAVMFGFTEGLRHIADDCKRQLKAPGGREDGSLVISAVSEHGSLETLRYLVEEKGFDLAFRTENGKTAAEVANLKNIPNAFLEYCYKRGAVPSGPQHVTPRVKASFGKAAEGDLKNLAGEGDVEFFNKTMQQVDRFSSHSTPLNASVFWGDAAKVRLHLKYGADPRQQDDQGIDAYGTLEALKTGGTMLGILPRHEQVRKLLDRHSRPVPGAARRRPRP